MVAVYVFEGSIKDNVWYCSTFRLANLIRVCTNVVAVYVFEGSIKDNVWYCSTFRLANLIRVCTNVVAVYSIKGPWEPGNEAN